MTGGTADTPLPKGVFDSRSFRVPPPEKYPERQEAGVSDDETRTPVTLTARVWVAMLVTVKKSPKPRQNARSPRIRVPNSERALFTISGTHFVGVLQRLSLTGGSAVLAKGPIAYGTMGDIALSTVYGKVSAHIEFLQSGADGVPLAQAFRFLAMEDASSQRFAKAAEEMVREGYSDAPLERPSSALSAPASETLGRLLQSVRSLAATLVASRSSAKS